MVLAAFTFTRLCRCLRILTALLGLLLLLCIAPARACSTGACVTAGPRLLAVNSTQGALLNAVYGNLLGGTINLSAADWNTLATGNINLLGLLGQVNATVGGTTPAQALNASLTLGQLAAAARATASASGNASLANAYANLGAQLTGIGATTQLGTLIQNTQPALTLGSTQINALDLLAGQAQLVNYNNLATTPAPVTISGSALGLSGVVNGIKLYAQVIEPPVMVCGPTGTTFHSAAIRVKLSLDLVTLNPDTSALGAVTGALGISAAIGQIDLYINAGRAEGTLSTVNFITQAVTLQAAPGLADLYVGSIPDSVFFNRTRPLNVASDLGYGNVGMLNISGAIVAIEVKSAAVGQAPLSSIASFSGPYPQSRTVGSSTIAVGNLITSLVTNLDLRVTPSLGGLVDGLVVPLLQTVVGGVLSPVLSTVLGGVADPLLQSLGVGVGQAVFTVEGICQACSLSGNAYNDVNQNSLKDAGETGTGVPLYAKLVAGGAVTAAVAIDPATGAYAFASVPAGPYTLILDTGNGTGVAPTGPPGWIATESPGFARAVTIAAADFTGINFGLYGGNTAFTLTKAVDKATALPGDALAYTLTFSNAGLTSVSNLRITDSTPNFTIYKTAACGNMPAGVTACSVSVHPAADQKGAVEWTVTGTLAPGASGTVTMNVAVE
ncbi:MAG: hypothetical protein ACRYF5_14675 [Janthinobacterium lividum]